MSIQTLSTAPTRLQNKKKMRIVFEIECDNSAAMFNRQLFDHQVNQFAALWNNPNTVKERGKIFGGPIVYLATQDC